MKLTELQFTFSQNVAKLINYIFEQGYYCTLGEAFRTKEQAELYSKRGIGSKNSLHCDRLAIDLNLFSPDKEYLSFSGDYKQFGEYWKTLNKFNKWGGDFLKRVDGNHFSMSTDGIRA